MALIQTVHSKTPSCTKDAPLTRISFFNQGGGPLLRDLVLSAGARFGRVSYYAPDSVTLSCSNLKAIKTPRHDNRGIVPRLTRWFGYVVILVAKGLTERGKPLLFIVTNPPFAPLFGFLASKLKRQRYVLLFYDIYPEALQRFGGFSDNSLLVRGWRYLNRLAIRNAARVITISPQMAQMLRPYLKEDDERDVDVVPTWVDADVIRPLPKENNSFAIQQGQVGKLTILYSGNLGRAHDLTMLPGIAYELRAYSDIQFLVIGDGAGRKPLEMECSRLALSNVTFLPFQDEPVLPLSLATGDIAIISLASGAEGISMPSKTYYMMAAGNALLGFSHPDSDLAGIIRDYQCGVNIMHGDIDGAVSAILEMRERPELLRAYRTQSRQAAERHFSRSVCVPMMLDLIQALI
jgi:glycosyltransferase involved in cell wall biosynthesis